MSTLYKTLLFVLTLSVIACHPKIAIENLSIQPELDKNARVAFLDVEQALPSKTTKIGDLAFKKVEFKSKNDLYTNILDAKNIARKNGANVVKAFEIKKGDATNYQLKLYSFEGDVAELEGMSVLFKKQAIDSIYNYIYLEECSLTTSNSLRRWCTELSIRRVVLQNYDYPAIKDSSTFENREMYKLKVNINKEGVVSGVDLTGCSNTVVKEAILKAFKLGNISFVQAQENKESDVLTIEVKLQATDFKAKSKGPDADHPQKPAELTEDQLLNSILKNTYQ